MKFTLPSLPYDYGALEPYLDAMTMEIHHTKHHQGYVNKLNAALEAHPDLQDKTVEELLADINALPNAVQTAVRNYGGGHFNHSMFWQIMHKNGVDEPKGLVGDAIKKHFDTFAAFQNTFNDAAKSVFGSGWAWACIDSAGKLVVVSTPNQDCPISQGLQPIMGLDVWEHAYYLQYQNKRPDYINAWWHVINWEKVEEHMQKIVL